MTEAYSIETGEKRTFGTVDYVLFALMLLASAAIGFYHAYRDRKKKNVDEFHFGGRKMHPIPVSLSLTATFVSALTLLGTPSEVYTNTTMYWWIVVAIFLATFGAAHLFIPIFYNLGFTSCFEYLEKRFGKVVRMAASIGFLFQTLVYMGFVLYAPSLALQAVTGLSLWGSMVGVWAVCTLYTMLGGMKTVLWTDSLQMVIMLIGLLWALIEGSMATGGFAAAWDIADSRQRILFTDYSFDPRTRHSIWTVAIGGSFFWMYLYGVNQAQVQRACSLPSLRTAQLALWLNFPGLVVIVCLCCMIGVVMFAFYSNCDPIKFGVIQRRDQLFPLFVMDILGDKPGVPGVFIACIFSGSLSTISSGLNALSAVFLEDYIRPYCCCGESVVARRGMLVSKILVLVVGVVQLGFAALISQFTGLVMQFSYSIYGILAGPLFGLFVSGMVFPWTNKWGALVGYIVSLVVMFWLGFGTIVAKLAGSSSPLSTAGCVGNVTTLQSTTITTAASMMSSTTASVVATESPDPLDEFYRMSYLWYTGFGLLVGVVVSLIISFLTGYTRPSTLDCRLMCPIFDRIFPCAPECVRKPLRFGVVYEDTSTEKSNVSAETGRDWTHGTEKGSGNKTAEPQDNPVFFLSDDEIPAKPGILWSTKL